MNAKLNGKSQVENDKALHKNIITNLKVLDQITLEKKFCLNFKIRSVFI